MFESVDLVAPVIGEFAAYVVDIKLIRIKIIQVTQVQVKVQGTISSEWILIGHSQCSVGEIIFCLLSCRVQFDLADQGRVNQAVRRGAVGIAVRADDGRNCSVERWCLRILTRCDQLEKELNILLNIRWWVGSQNRIK